MASLNKVILIGNLGKDPEVRYTQGGQAVCELRLATSEQWNDKDGQKQERTEWHSITVWGKTAESCGQYLAKGRPVYVEGRLQSREYQDKEGITRRVWEVQADKVLFLGGGGDEAGQRQTRSNADSTRPAPGTQGGKQGTPQGGQGQTRGSAGGGGRGGWGGGADDDPIPF